METATWNCCRMCLSEQNLYPIFIDVQHHEKYSNVIYMVSGIKVDLKDNLPKEICSTCINHINESTKFRKRCEETNLQLLNHVNDKQTLIKTETSQIKQETQTTIDITHLLEDFDDEFKDYDDNITLDSLQFHNSIAKTDNDSNKINCDTFVNSIENVEKKVSKKADCRPKRKLKGSKKENNVRSEKEKQREEIECEYCHKVLTSRLSLRNHYKIHTGFDIVCEHCGKKFINKRLLLMHCKAKHGYEKTDKCSFCDYKASNAEQVKIHERLHTGEKPFVCSDCGAGFHRKSSYLQHVAIHLPEKTVQCEKCPARFKSVTLMRIHANRHREPTYSFECRICDGSFARRRNVARHLQRVHGLPPSQQHIERRKIV